MQTINNQIFTDFLSCRYKAYLKLQGKSGQKSEYEKLMDSISVDYLKRAKKHIADSGILLSTRTSELISDINICDGNISSHIDVLAREQHPVELSNTRYTPVMFSYRNKIIKEDKLLLAFTSEILSRNKGFEPDYGRIIHGDIFSNTKVHLTKSLISESRRILTEIVEINNANSVPQFRLNKHCNICEYQEICHSTAIQKDDLSLLSGMGDKDINSLNKKGISTITQFSYTFRPRKKTKKAIKYNPKHYHSLTALALREKRIYITDRPVIPSSGVNVYLDIEGIPDRDFYYLVGILISDGKSNSYHSFWANNNEDEEKIWKSFLNIVDEIDDLTLYHYGSYESEYFKRMQKKYGGADVINRIKSKTVNVLSLIYAHIYFPTYSNALKSIANYLGFCWSSPNATGIQSIAWRYSWEITNQDELKQKLVKYNYEDCLGLQLVTKKLKDISNEDHRESSELPNPILTTDEIKREYQPTFKAINFLLPDLDKINKCSYYDYQRSKVHFRTNPTVRKSLLRQRRKEPSNDGIKAIKVNKEIRCQRPSKCKFCEAEKPEMRKKLSRVVYDLKLSKGGIGSRS